MKKIMCAVAMGLLSFSVSAQNWLVSGSISYTHWSWGNPYTSESDNQFGLSLSGGRYLTEKWAVGLRGTVNFLFGDGNQLAAGPWVTWEFVQIDKIVFALTGRILYTRYNDSYSWNAAYDAEDANRISFTILPSVIYRVSENLDLYLQFFEAGYFYDWLTLSDIKCHQDRFFINGPLGNPSFGIRVRF
ncbi:MAG: hypothetical protein LBP32_00580 [Spirochaetaceae bacterium]|jgi:long-subunit fatty acid transport protein|nr:hypothetical protein [Spirochaetaceae bacterium]